MITGALDGEQVLFGGGQTVRATVTCAALTGLQFDRAEMAHQGYGEARLRLLRRLDPACEDPAEPGDDSAHRPLFGASNERGTASISVPLLSVESEESLRRVVEAVESMAATFEGSRIDVLAVKHNLFDFGVATLDVSFELTSLKPYTSDEVRDSSALLRAELEAALGPEVRRMTEEFRGAVSTADLGRADPTTLMKEDATIGIGGLADDDGEYGRLLWIHTVYLLACAAGEDLVDAHHEIRQLVPSFAEDLVLPGAVVSPGLQVSVGAYCPDHPRSRESSEALVRVMCDMNAWWTAIWHMDHLVFKFLSEIRRRRRVTSGRGLESQARAIEEMYDHVTIVKALLDSFALNLSGVERGVWDVAARLWWLNTNLQAVTSKLAALRDIHASIAAELRSRVDKRLELLLAVFTVFGAIGSLAGVGQFLWPGGGEPDGASRMLMVSGSALLSLAFLIFALWVRPDRKIRRSAHHVQLVESPVR